jgi:ABC-type protease/lipase transport system fused ATPase/permease subunit
MVLHTALDGSWKPLYTCIVSFLFHLVLACILIACFALVSCLCINYGRLATLFMIAL